MFILGNQFMPTFSSILHSFPQTEETRRGATRYVGAFILVCFVVTLVLLGAAYYLQQRALLYAVFILLSLAVAGMLVNLFIDVRDSKPFFRNPGGYMADGLDRRFEQEKLIAAELAATELIELQRMKTRLEADLIRSERFLDVLKPLSMLGPIVLVVVSIGLFRLPGWIQDICKVVAASIALGAIAASIPIYEGLVKLRTLSSTLHFAIELAEANRKPRFRKVSRKRS
jgi:hypothetical protein